MKPKHDPGGKVRIALRDGITGSALFGGEKKEYRYRLDRVWEPTEKFAMFVLMNPSTAEADIDDSTIAKCCRFARAWGYGGIVVANTLNSGACNRGCEGDFGQLHRLAKVANRDVISQKRTSGQTS